MRPALPIVHVDGRLVGRSIVLSPLVDPLEFGSLEHLKFMSDLPPLIDEVQVQHADCVILARKRTMMTLHCLLSTIFDPANHWSQHRLLRYVPLLNAHIVPSLNFRLVHRRKVLSLCEGIMAEGKWVSYLRVSTGRQGRSGSVWKHTVPQSRIAELQACLAARSECRAR